MADDVLNRYRRTIDNIDAAVICMLAERFKVTRAVGALKAALGHSPADPDREKRQIARLRQLATEAQLDPDFSEKFLRFIVTEVIRHHERIAQAHAENHAENGERPQSACIANLSVGENR